MNRIPDIRLDGEALERFKQSVRTAVHQLQDHPFANGIRLADVPLNDGEVTRVAHGLGRRPLGWTVTRTKYKGAEVYDSGNQTITSGATLALSHGLGGEPLEVQAHLVCVNAEDNWAQGDKLILDHEQHFAAAASERGVVFKITSTNITACYGSQAVSVFLGKDATTFNAAAHDNANWAMVVRASRYRRLIDQQAAEPYPDQYLRLLGAGFVDGETVDLWVF